MRRVTLVAYRAFSDLAGKGSFLLITVVAAHRLTQRAFGIFALASALGWIVSVITDFGIQLHVARAVAWRTVHNTLVNPALLLPSPHWIVAV